MHRTMNGKVIKELVNLIGGHSVAVWLLLLVLSYSLSINHYFSNNLYVCFSFFSAVVDDVFFS